MSWAVLIGSHLLVAVAAALAAATITRSFPSGSSGTGEDESRTESKQRFAEPLQASRKTLRLPTKLPQRSLTNKCIPELDSPDGSEEAPIEPFSEWALNNLLGQCHDSNSVKCAVIRQQLKKIAALYLRGNINEIQAAIKKFGLDEVIVDFMSKQCSASTDLKALSLQMSRAFARDALTSAAAANHRISKQLSSTQQAGFGGAAPPSLHTSTVDKAVPAERFAQGGGTDKSVAARLGLVNALSFYQEGSIGLGTAEGFSGDVSSSEKEGAESPVQSFSMCHGSVQAAQTLTPSTTDVLRAQADRILAGTGCTAKPGRSFLEKFGSRTILTYLMRELEALLTIYLNQNWDRMDMVKAANEPDLYDESFIAAAGPMCSHQSLSTSSVDKETQGPNEGSSVGANGLVHLSDQEETNSDSPQSPESRNSRGIAKQTTMRSSQGSWASLCLTSASRARRNWQRAMQAYVKQETVRFLRPRREFQTMAQLLQELAKPHRQNRTGDPIFLFLGGGMAAGKSTVRELLSSDSLWSKIGSSAVVIEADAIKNHDVVLQELRSSGLFNQEDANLSQFVHEYSTKKAQGALVAAINEQRDIIFDGTCSWEPFVLQTIDMLRDHVHDYQQGPGYQRASDGSTVEQYWVRVSSTPHVSRERVSSTSDSATSEPGTLADIHQSITNKTPESSQNGGVQFKKRPYRIELVGVTCAAELAVARGFWRQIQTGRGVPVAAQLRSFCLFAQSWPTYCRKVDSATLYHTGSDLTTMAKDQQEIDAPRVIAHVSVSTRGQLLVEPVAYKEFQQQIKINAEATCVDELFPRTLISFRSSILRCPSQKKGRVSMLRAALGHASNRNKEVEHTRNNPSKATNIRRTMSSTLDSQPSYERQRQAMSLPEAITE